MQHPVFQVLWCSYRPIIGGFPDLNALVLSMQFQKDQWDRIRKEGRPGLPLHHRSTVDIDKLSRSRYLLSAACYCSLGAVGEGEIGELRSGNSGSREVSVLVS